MPTPIENIQQYENTLAHIYELMQKDIQPGSKEADNLEKWVALVKDYENKHHPITKTNSPRSVISIQS